MARVVKPTAEVFPPSDRELALRAQIKTGWSTISNHDVHNLGLSPSELKHIQQVLERAQAMERMEQIRIGLQVLKHKQNIDRCRGDGVTTCRICNRDFTNKRSLKSEPIQYCVDCQMVVCTRCRMPEKVVGERVVLCNICHEERELWKKSGSWLDNTVPDFENFTIPMENLEEIQEKMTTTRRLTSRHREKSEFVNPFQIEAEDQDDDEGDISPPLADSQRIDFTPSPSREKRDVQGISKSFDLEFVASHSRSSSMDEEIKSTSITDLGGSFPRSRESGFTRRRAISKADKSRLMSSRERARSTSRRHGSGVPSPTLSGGGSPVPPPTKASEGEGDGNQPSVPSIKIRKPSTQTAPYSSHAQPSSHHQIPPQSIPAGDSDIETEPSKVIRQMQKMSSTESDVMVVSSEYLPSSSPLQISVEQGITTASATAARKQWTATSRSSSSSSSPDHHVPTPPSSSGSPSPRSHSSSKPEPLQEVRGCKPPTGGHPSLDKKPTPDLFRKVGGVSSSSAEPKASERRDSDTSNTFKKVVSSKSPEPAKTLEKREDFSKTPSKFPEVQKSPITEKKSDPSDLFKKVGGSPPSRSAERSPSLERKSDTGDIFKKVGGSPIKSEVGPSKSDTSDIFKKVKGSSPSTSERSPSLEKKSDGGDIFKKVGGSPSKSEVGLSKSDTSDIFKKVGGGSASTSERSSSLEKKSDVGDIFKKVGGAPSRSSRSPSLETKREESGDLFKKVGGAPSKQTPKQSPAKDSRPERGAEPAVVPVKVTPLMSSPPSHPAPTLINPPQSPNIPPSSSPTTNTASTTSAPSKPVPAKRRLLPAPPQEVGTGGQVSISPELQRKVMMSDLGKQSSTTSALSEMSTTMETDSAMDSPTSVTSSGSGGSQGRFPPVVSPSEPPVRERSPQPESEGMLERSPRQRIARRNATRSSGRTRGFPRPQGIVADDGEEIGPPPTTTHSLTAELDAGLQDSEGGSPRIRTRSGAVRRTRRPIRPQQGESSGSELKPAGASSSAMDFPDFPGEAEEASLGRRSRGSRVTNQDRGLARVARETARERSETPPKVKADGQFGSINMSLSYDEVKEELTVTVHSCKGLRVMDKNGSSDPYVKLFLQPRSKLQKFRTKTIFRNLNPIFKETFTFAGLCKESLARKKLCAVVMDYDELTRDDLIGGTQINLYEVVGSSSGEICIKRLLDDRSVPKQDLIIKDRGTLHFALRYSSDNQALVVSILGARNIGDGEVYIKCQWMSRGKTFKVKSKTFPKSADPVFNEELAIPAALRDLNYCTLTLGLWERRSFKDKHLGEVQLSNVTFWKEFTHTPGKVVDDWYSLEPPSHANHINSPTGRLSN